MTMEQKYQTFLLSNEVTAKKLISKGHTRTYTHVFLFVILRHPRPKVIIISGELGKGNARMHVTVNLRTYV